MKLSDESHSNMEINLIVSEHNGTLPEGTQSEDIQCRQ